MTMDPERRHRNSLMTGLLARAGILLVALVCNTAGYALSPLPAPTDAIVALPDYTGAAVPEYVIYRGDEQNVFTFLDGNDGSELRTVKFFSSAWQPQAFAALADGNGDGTLDDPALAVLAFNSNTGQIKVQLRDATTGDRIGSNIAAFNSDWNALGLAILADADGNGVADDPAAAVLAQNTVDERIMVDLIRFSDGAQLGRWKFFTPSWEAKSVAAYVPAGGAPRIAVLATDPVSGRTRIQYRLTTIDGKTNVFVSGPGIDTFDMDIMLDVDGNGTADDPAFVVVGKKVSGTENNVVFIIRESDGLKLADWSIINGSYDARGMEIIPDISLNGYEEIVALAQPVDGGNLLIRIRDLEGGNNVDTLTGPAVISPLPGLYQRPANTTCVAPDRPTNNAGYRLEQVFAGLGILQEPLWMGQPPGDSSRWFVAQRLGRIFSFENTPGVDATITVLDLDLAGAVNEGGVLGFAFAPDWATSRQAYVSYTRNVTGIPGVVLQSVISRFGSADGGMTLDPTTEQEILVINHPYDNHNGGGIAFGPDGYLYLGMGDGGSTGDPDNNGQTITNLLGTFIRIDVSGGGTGYSIPEDNPFEGNMLCTNGSGSEPCPEIFAWGLRNPFRWSFDRATGDLWAGDVGNLLREEVSLIELGGNYGWVVKEGFICLDPNDNLGILPDCDDAGMIDPVVDYNSGSDIGDLGRTVIGGYVYRGTALTDLIGSYVFGDAYSSNIWTLEDDGNGNVSIVDLIPNTGLFISSFAESLDGELFVVNLGGSLWQLVEDNSGGTNTIPGLLSDTGCVDAADPTQPASGLIPFEPAAPFWSDGAAKPRWLAIPDGTSITVNGDDDLLFPEGSVLVKNFERGGKLIETRLLMHHASGGGWAGYSYRWNDAETEATRVIGGAVLPAPTGGDDWVYPSESQCLQCHTAAANRVLGPEIAQLNSSIIYPHTGRTANQLATLDAINMLSPPLADEPANLSAFPDPFGTAPLEERARAYLHTNCSGCHRPGTPLQATMDLRYDTPLADTNACNADPITGGDLGIPGARLIAPGDPDSSLVHVRMGLRDARGMPPLGSLIVDDAGAQLISDWIISLGSCD